MPHRAPPLWSSLLEEVRTGSVVGGTYSSASGEVARRSDSELRLFFGELVLTDGVQTGCWVNTHYLGYKNKVFIVAVRPKPVDIWFECEGMSYHSEYMSARADWSYHVEYTRWLGVGNSQRRR